MDPGADVFYGPHPIQSTGTVTVPRILLREIGLEVGIDKIHWALNPDMPGTLLLISDRTLAHVQAAALDLLRGDGR